MMRVIAVTVMGAVLAGQSADPAVGTRVRALTRESAWTLLARIPMRFPTYHPQGMVKIGDTLYVSSVQITVPTRRFAEALDGYDRDAGEGIGHLFKVDLRPGTAGALLASTVLGESTMYHPGGIDFDGRSLWVPVAEYRPNSRSIVYKVEPQTLASTVVLRFADHIGGVVLDPDARALHGISWGSRRFYRWPLAPDGTVAPVTTPPSAMARPNPSHYVDYQDCHYAGRGAMLCGGISDLRPSPDAAPVRLGGLDLVDLADGRPLHQVPISLRTSSGLAMTRNPIWIEPATTGLRAYFMPEDDTSVLYVYEVR